MSTTMEKTKEIVCAGMFTAVLAILSQLAIPMPTGVPITLQTFAVALTFRLKGGYYESAIIKNH